MSYYGGQRSRQRNQGNLWVVLVSGIPNGLAYSTESDICRTYHIAKSHGIPDERIIVFMHDVAGPAHNYSLYNEEGGPNVYIGVPKDYTGENWTKETVLMEQTIRKSTKQNPPKKQS